MKKHETLFRLWVAAHLAGTAIIAVLAYHGEHRARHVDVKAAHRHAALAGWDGRQFTAPAARDFAPHRAPQEKSRATVRRPLARVQKHVVSRGGWRRAVASWYGPGLYGNRTADGTLFTPRTWCVAHRTLPLGTLVEIRYRGRTVTVPVRDRGPFVAGRDFDLSAAVARALRFAGVDSIEWRIVE